MSDQPKPGDLQVWWVPQIPGKSFLVDVESVEEGVRMMSVLAEYDAFQYENRIKPDYANAGGLNVYEKDYDGEGTDGWVSWYDPDSGEDDPEKYLRSR